VSAIFGFLRLDGAPADPEELALMQAALADHGPDASTWCRGPLAIGVLDSRRTPEDHGPVLRAEGDRVAAAIARLDMRQEVLSRLSITAGEAAARSDAELVLEAHRRWGEGCLSHLDGDYTAVAWDPGRGALWIGRDRIGSGRVAWHRGRELFAFATEARGLLAHPAVPRRIDPRFALRRLLSFPEIGSQYEEIAWLPCGHVMNASSRRVEPRRYFSLADAPAVRLPSDEDYAEALRAELERAVRDRVRSALPVAVTLSAGLDSGSVAALAAASLAARGERLLAFTAGPLHDVRGAVPYGREGDEGPLAAAVARHAGSIDHVVVRSEQSGPLRAIERAVDSGRIPVAASNEFWLQDLAAEARRHGIGTILTGHGGNFTISWGGARSGPVLNPAALARRWRQATSEGIRRALWRALRARLRPILGTGKRLVRMGSAEDRLAFMGTALRPGALRDLGLMEWAQERRAAFRADMDGRTLRTVVMGVFTEFWGWSQIATSHGIDSRDPALDRRVVELCLGIPEAQYALRGDRRSLVKRAMRGRLPDAVLHARRRGLQAADIGFRLLRERDLALDLIARIERSPEASFFVDGRKLRETLRALEQRVDAASTTRLVHVLLPGLSVGTFLAAGPGRGAHVSHSQRIDAERKSMGTSMSTPDSGSTAVTYCRKPGLLAAEVDGEVAIMSTERGQYYGLGESARRIWELLESPMDLASLASQLTAEYDVDAETCARSTAAFLDELSSEGLLLRVDPVP
jgi:asparagine synthase (glutamine-hydrolysing)